MRIEKTKEETVLLSASKWINFSILLNVNHKVSMITLPLEK